MRNLIEAYVTAGSAADQALAVAAFAQVQSYINPYQGRNFIGPGDVNWRGLPFDEAMCHVTYANGNANVIFLDQYGRAEIADVEHGQIVRRTTGVPNFMLETFMIRSQL